jgi:Mg2+ and Co2+ transporter CorA
MSQEDDTVVENLDDAMKYKLLKFFSSMTLSPTQIRSIEEAVSTIMDLKIDEHKKRTGERIGQIERELVEIKHELLNKIKDISADQAVKDTKQDSFIGGLKVTLGWLVPAIIGAFATVVVTWVITRS